MYFHWVTVVITRPWVCVWFDSRQRPCIQRWWWWPRWSIWWYTWDSQWRHTLSSSAAVRAPAASWDSAEHTAYWRYSIVPNAPHFSISVRFILIHWYCCLLQIPLVYEYKLLSVHVTACWLLQVPLLSVLYLSGLALYHPSTSGSLIFMVLYTY